MMVRVLYADSSGYFVPNDPIATDRPPAPVRQSAFLFTRASLGVGRVGSHLVPLCVNTYGDVVVVVVSRSTRGPSRRWRACTITRARGSTRPLRAAGRADGRRPRPRITRRTTSAPSTVPRSCGEVSRTRQRAKTTTKSWRLRWATCVCEMPTTTTARATASAPSAGARARTRRYSTTTTARLINTAPAGRRATSSPRASSAPLHLSNTCITNNDTQPSQDARCLCVCGACECVLW